MANVEAPNNLLSNTRVKIIDVLGEGWMGCSGRLFVPVSGVSGTNPLCSVFFDDIPVMNGDGSPNWNISGQGFAFQYTSGASGQSPMVGFERVEALVPLPFNTRVFNPPPNNGYPKAVIATFNTTQYPDAEGVKVTTRVPAMYTVNTANGDTNQFSLFYQIDISLNGGAWVPQILGPDGNGDPSTVKEIKGKCTSPYYHTHVIPLPKTTPAASYYEWKVRVRRIDQNIMSSNTANDLYVDTVAVVSSNTYSYPMVGLVGLELSADQFGGSVPSRAYEIYGIQCVVPNGYAPTVYNADGTITAASYPTVWNGTYSTTRLWTDNPAWIFYDLVTNKRYGLGQYIQPSWIDKWTLYQIAQYCDELVDDGKGGLEPRFTCNVAITSAQDAYTLLNNFVSVFRGMLYWANGSLFPVGPETRDPVFNFTNANVVGGAFSYADTPKNTRTTVCVVRWVDPSNQYRPTPERIEDLNGIGKYGYIEKYITAFATTSRGQAIRAAKWLLTVEQLLTETVSFQTDLEGLYLRPGDVFNVYDNYRNNQQQGGKITDISQTFTARDTISFDRDVTLEAGFTYVLSAIVPATNWATGQNITGSSQVGLIRNSQIETRQVITPAGAGYDGVVTSGGFSAALFRGSTWILNGSGTSVTVFDQATQYKCLVASEPKNGIVEVLGVKYDTGINYLVNNNYSAETQPPIEGDTTPPLPPTGLHVQPITGLLNDNTFFRYAYVYWTGSTSVNTSYYDVSGRLAAGSWFAIGRPTTTGITYVPDSAGLYTFRAAAFNANGYGSAYTEGTYTEPSTNPLGPTAALSGIIIRANYDPYVIAPAPVNRATGYITTQPVFEWDVALDGIDDTLETPTAQFITGYRARILPATGGQWSLTTNPFINEGKDNTFLTWNDRFLYTGTSITALRAFTLQVDTLDEYGNTVSGGQLAVNNVQPRPPIGSGFVGYNGGVSYAIQPPRMVDLSGVMLWTNQSPTFTPTYGNATLFTPNMAGFVDAPRTGSFYTWFALVDTFGFSGSISAVGDYNSPIYGPISGNANQIVGDLFVSIDQEIGDAFSTLTDMITNTSGVLTGQDYIALSLAQGLSGQVIGSTPGAANTALNVRVNTAVASSSGALSTQINAVAASVVTANNNISATGATLISALATTGGALSQSITSLQAYTSGQSSRVTIAAQAFVTGDVNGFGGAAVARYGFKLDANGKVVSMEATSSSFPNTFGTIVFGGADLQSNTFSAGSAGWRIKAGGDAEFNNISARGAFTGGAGAALTIIDNNKWLVGNPAGTRMQALANDTNAAISFITSAGNNVATVGIGNIGGGQGGYIQLLNPSISPTITLAGEGGSINCDILSVDSTSTFSSTATHNAEIAISSTNKLNFTAGGGATYIDENWGLNLHGDSDQPVRIRGCALVLNDSAVTTFTAGRVYDENSEQILRERYAGAAPTTLANVITILQYHGLCN